jgi:hypothetical protein
MKYLVLVGCALVLGAASVRAGDPAVTDIAQVDSLYSYVGEYVGHTARGEVGVRVSTQPGPQPLFARIYPGGLPGMGWGTATPELVAGGLDDRGATLRSKDGSGRELRVAGGQLVLVEPTGQPVPLRKLARRSVTQGQPAPLGAKVLFDGKDTSAWKNARLTPDGLLRGGTETVEPLVGGHLHVEFRTPYMPKSTGQKRGNSGVYLQRRYEVQILESFALEGIENECGAIYRQRRPDINMALPPLVWQTYDIFLVPPVFSNTGKKIKGAELTVVHNGVPVHYHTLVLAKTGAGREEGPEPLPLLLQDHGDPVVFRNIWFVPSQSLPSAWPATAGKLDLPRAHGMDGQLFSAALLPEQAYAAQSLSPLAECPQMLGR